MHWVEPKVFVLAETKVELRGMKEFLNTIGAENFPIVSDSGEDAEHLVEVAGRMCYRSFNTDMNKNLTRIREGNKDYIGNILRQKHGSVLEHASVSFACVDVSRIFTHELVRHRAGVAISQESGRFIRIDNIGMYLPSCLTPLWIEDNLAAYATPESIEAYAGNKIEWAKELSDQLVATVVQATKVAEASIKTMNNWCNLDHASMPFHIKKELTSAFRRIASGGITNNIIFTANHRAIRHMISMRTALGAEEEIRQVFGEYTNDEEMRGIFLKVANHMKKMYASFYQDMTIHNDGTCTFENEKV